MEPSEIVGQMIDEVLNNGDFIPPEAGRKIAEQMRSQYPDEHLAFLDQQAEQIYTTLLRDMNRRRRGHYAMTQDARAFAEAAEEGDVSMFVAWRCKIDDEGTQRCIGEMTGPDHIYVATDYANRAAANAMLAAFHRAVAKKVGKRTTAEVFSEDELTRLYNSIAGSTTQAA